MRRVRRLCSVVLIYCTVWAVITSQFCATAKATSSVEVLGGFSNLKLSYGHAFGYVLKLWKDGNQIFGLLCVYTGEPADPPTGILEDVKFDPRTAQLSFSARLSTALVYAGAYVPSRDRVTFKGVLTRSQVTGTLTTSDELFPDKRPTSQRIRLRRSRSSTELMIPPPPTYSAWKTWADTILKRRGPKW